jgi:PPE-repeat protein
MDFAILPPEVNSARMYAGPGAAPMLGAAQAWAALAGELYSTASSYGSVVSILTSGPWLGPSSTAMAAAGVGYQAWLSSTAAQADETAAQAAAAAAAFEAAFAATVPPVEVAANRTQLAVLVATNLLGQNTAAIAATEAQYFEMWAQDAAAMFDYAGSSAAATQLTPFSSPRQATSAEGLAGQAAAAGQAGQGSAGTAQSVLSQIFSVVPNALGNLKSSSVLGSLTPLDLLDIGADFIAYGLDAPMSPLGAISLPIDLIGAQTGLHTDDIVSGWSALGAVPGAVEAAPAAVASGAVSGAVPTVSAAFGEADAIGPLTVPPTWIPATPAVRPIALALSTAGEGADSQVWSSVFSNTFGEVALANAAGRSLGENLGPRGRERAKAAAEWRPQPHASTGAQDEKAEADAVAGEPRTVVTGIAAEIREFAKLRDDGLVSDEEFQEQRNRLLGRPTGGIA